MEYANIKLFKTKVSRINKADLDKAVKYHNKYKKLKPVIVDSDYNIIKNAVSYYLGKKIHLKYLLSERKKFFRAAGTTFPLGIKLEFTTRCNLFCRMCPRNQLTRPLKNMDFSIFKKIIDEISNYKINGLWLYNIGESMIHPQFFEMLEYINRYPTIHPIWLSTNGTTLNEKNSLRLLKLKTDYLNVSLNALDAKNHFLISRRPYFKLIMSNLNNLITLKKKLKKRKPFIRVQIIDQPEIHGQVKKFIEEWGPKADIISINKLETYAGQKEIPTNKILKGKTKINFGPCLRIDRGMLHIFSNNQVGICATDFNCINCIGDVSKNTIYEIWNGKKFKQLYNYIKNRRFDKIPFCYNCNDRQLA